MRLLKVEETLSWAFQQGYIGAAEAALEYAGSTMTKAYVQDNGTYNDTLAFRSVADASSIPNDLRELHSTRE